MKKIAHIGIHSGSNIGDLAINEIITQWAKKKYSFVKVEFNIKSYKGDHLISKFITMIKFYFKKIPTCDFAIIGGGNILMGNDMVFPLQFLFHVLILKFFKKKITLFCIGVGPFGSSLPILIIKLGLFFCDQIICRDIKSKILVKKIGFDSQILEDPVFTYSYFNKTTPTKRYDIGISLMALGSVNFFKNGCCDYENNFFNKTCQLIEKYNQSHLNMILIATDNNRDVDFVHRVAKELSFPVNLAVLRSTKMMGEIISSCRMFVACRMHSAIFGFSYNIPSFCFNWQPKIEGMYMQLGLENMLINLNGDFTFNIDHVFNNTKSYIDTKSYDDKKISSLIEQIIDRHKKFWNQIGFIECNRGKKN